MSVAVEEPQAAERRGFERTQMRIPVIHQPWGRQRLGDAFSVDLSASGMQALFDRNFRRNQWLQLWLVFPQRETPLRARGRVVWIRRKNEDTWRAGVEFDEVNLVGLKEYL